MRDVPAGGGSGLLGGDGAEQIDGRTVEHTPVKSKQKQHVSHILFEASFCFSYAWLFRISPRGWSFGI